MNVYPFHAITVKETCVRLGILCMMMATLLACGATQSAQEPTLAPLSVSVDLPSLEHAIRDAMASTPSTAAEAFMDANLHVLNGDIDSAFDALMTPDIEWNQEVLRVGRMAFFAANYPDLIDVQAFHTWLQALDVRTMLPQERVILTSLQRSVVVAQLEERNRDTLPSPLPYGGADSWTVMGPVAGAMAQDVESAGALATVSSLQELPLRGRQKRHTYATILGWLPHNPFSNAVAYYESYLKIGEPTRVAVTRFGKGDVFQVWVNDTSVLSRLVDDSNTMTWQMNILDLTPGVYRITMALYSGQSAVQPPQIIPLKGEIEAFSADAGPPRGGDIQHVKHQASNISAALGQADHEHVLTWLVQAQVAMLGDDQLAYDLARQTPQSEHPLMAYMRARLLEYVLDDPLANAQAQRLLDEIDASWGEWDAIEIKKAVLGLRSAGDEQAPIRLAPKATDEHASPHLRYAYAVMMRNLGFEAISYHTVEKLAQQYPMWCDVWTMALRQKQSYRGVLNASDFENAPQTCAGVRTLQADILHKWKGDDAPSNALALQALRRNANSPDSAVEYFWRLMAARDYAAAETWLKQLPDYGVRDEALTLPRAAMARLSNDPQKIADVYTDASTRYPDNLDARLRAAGLRGERFLDAFRVDGDAMLKEYREHKTAADEQGTVTYILDYGSWRIEEDGSGIGIQHQILRLNSSDAVQEFGEVEIPASSVVLDVRVIKADGSVRRPERIANKDSLSIPDLEVGDILEREYASVLTAREDGDIVIRSPNFYFASPAGPMYLSRLDIQYPESWGDNAKVDAHQFEGEITRTRENGMIHERYDVRHQDEAVSEPMAVEHDEFFPWVQFRAFPNKEQVRKTWANFIAPQVAPSPEITALRKSILQGVKGDERQIKALFDYVVQEVESDSSFYATSARETARVLQGDRSALLYALLHDAGFDPQICLVKNADRALVTRSFPDLEDYSSSVLMVALKKKSLWLDPSEEYAPFNQLKGYEQGQDAIVVVGSKAGEIFRTPDNREQDAVNHVHMNIWLDADGQARIQIKIQESVLDSMDIRQMLLYQPDATERRHLFEEQLKESLGSVSITKLAFEGEQDPDQPLTILIEAESSGLVDEQADRLILDKMLLPPVMLLYFTTAASRKTPLLIDDSWSGNMDVTIHPPKGWTLARTVRDVQLQEGNNRYTRSVSQKGDVISWSRIVHVPPAHVSPQEYESLAAFGVQVRASERIRLEWVR